MAETENAEGKGVTEIPGLNVSDGRLFTIVSEFSSVSEAMDGAVGLVAQLPDALSNLAKGNHSEPSVTVETTVVLTLAVHISGKDETYVQTEAQSVALKVDEILEQNKLPFEVSRRSGAFNILRADGSDESSSITYSTDTVSGEGVSSEDACSPTPWSTWTACQHRGPIGVCTLNSTDDRAGTRSRFRDWVGEGCSNATSNIEAANRTAYRREFFSEACTVFCPIDCVMSSWSAPSPCDKACGGGKRFRTRNVLQPAIGEGMQCGPSRRYEFGCSPSPCPVNCSTSEWETGACSTNCGLAGGAQRSTRTVLVQPKHGGAECGSLVSEVPCTIPVTSSCFAAVQKTWYVQYSTDPEPTKLKVAFGGNSAHNATVALLRSGGRAGDELDHGANLVVLGEDVYQLEVPSRKGNAPLIETWTVISDDSLLVHRQNGKGCILGDGSPFAATPVGALASRNIASCARAQQLGHNKDVRKRGRLDYLTDVSGSQLRHSKADQRAFQRIRPELSRTTWYFSHDAPTAVVLDILGDHSNVVKDVEFEVADIEIEWTIPLHGNRVQYSVEILRRDQKTWQMLASDEVAVNYGDNNYFPVTLLKLKSPAVSAKIKLSMEAVTALAQNEELSFGISDIRVGGRALPVQCRFGQWGPWGTCDGEGEKCIGSSRARKRPIDQQAFFGGTPCKIEELKETKICSASDCWSCFNAHFDINFESDVDCGGRCKQKCTLGHRCTINEDCASNLECGLESKRCELHLNDDACRRWMPENAANVFDSTVNLASTGSHRRLNSQFAANCVSSAVQSISDNLYAPASEVNTHVNTDASDVLCQGYTSFCMQTPPQSAPRSIGEVISAISSQNLAENNVWRSEFSFESQVNVSDLLDAPLSALLVQTGCGDESLIQIPGVPTPDDKIGTNSSLEVTTESGLVTHWVFFPGSINIRLVDSVDMIEISLPRNATGIPSCSLSPGNGQMSVTPITEAMWLLDGERTLSARATVSTDGNAGTSTSKKRILQLSPCPHCTNIVPLAKLSRVLLSDDGGFESGFPPPSTSDVWRSAFYFRRKQTDHEQDITTLVGQLGGFGWAAEALGAINARLYQPEIIMVVDDEHNTYGFKVRGDFGGSRKDLESWSHMEAVFAYDDACPSNSTPRGPCRGQSKSAVVFGIGGNLKTFFSKLFGYDLGKIPALSFLLGSAHAGVVLAGPGAFSSRRTCPGSSTLAGGDCHVLQAAPSHVNMSFQSKPLDRVDYRPGVHLRAEIRSPGTCGGDLLCNVIAKAIPPGISFALNGQIDLSRQRMADTADVYGTAEVSIGVEEIDFGDGVVLREVAWFFSAKLRLEALMSDRLQHLKNKDFLSAVLSNPRITGETGIRGTLAVRVGSNKPGEDRKELVFTGGLSLLLDLGAPSLGGSCPADPDGVSVCARMLFTMAGMWENVFGYNRLHLGNIVLVLTGKIIDPPIPPYLEYVCAPVTMVNMPAIRSLTHLNLLTGRDFNVVAGGELWLGDPDEIDHNTGDPTAIRMCAYVGLGFVRWWDSFIFARTDTISLHHLVRAFAGPKAWTDWIPEELMRISGLNEEGVLVSATMTSGKRIPVCSTFCSGARPVVVPDGDSCSVVEIPPGLHVIGRVTLLGVSAKLNVTVDFDHAHVEILVDPVHLAGGLIAMASTEEEALRPGGPQVGPYVVADVPLLDYLWDLIDGKELQPPVLGGSCFVRLFLASAQATFHLNHNGEKLLLEISAIPVFFLWNARVQLRIGDSWADWRLTGEFYENDLIPKLLDATMGFLISGAQHAADALGEAKQAIDDAQTAVRVKQGELESAKRSFQDAASDLARRNLEFSEFLSCHKTCEVCDERCDACSSTCFECDNDCGSCNWYDALCHLRVAACSTAFGVCWTSQQICEGTNIQCWDDYVACGVRVAACETAEAACNAGCGLVDWAGSNALALAEILVRESQVLVDVAQAALEMAILAMEGAKIVLAGLKAKFEMGIKVGQWIHENTSQLLRIKRVSFQFEANFSPKPSGFRVTLEMVVFGEEITKIIGLPLDDLKSAGKSITDESFPGIDTR